MSENLNFNPFAESFAKITEAKIESDKIKNTHDNALILTKKNVDFFGGRDEEKKSEISETIFNKFGRGYKNVEDIVAASKDPNRDNKMAKLDLESLTNSVWIAMNMSVLLEGELITPSMTVEQIDEVLPKEMTRLGNYIKEMDSKLNEKNKKQILEINKDISGIIGSKKINDIKQLIKNNSGKEEGSLERQYGDLAISYLVGSSSRSDKNKPDDDDDEGFVKFEEVEGKQERTVNWMVTMEKLAEGMKLMEQLRWQTLTPPKWFNELSPDEQYKVEIMISMCDSSVSLLYAGKELDKILGSNYTFGFTHEHMNKLFDKDFTLVMSKMVNEMCEFYTDQNGIKCLRYKERFYQADKNSPDGFAHDANNRRILMVENETNKNLGIRTIDEDVIKNLENINDYKESLALSLANSNGRKESTTMDKMNAYTAWNMVFGMGDSSTWDRMRILPTWNGVISDALRTLNSEYKAKAKWQVLKGGKVRKDENLFDAEYFSGPMADYILKIMKMERDLGKAIDGKKTMREKIISGEMSVLGSKTYYGILDFVNEGRDLVIGDGKSMADLLMSGKKVEFKTGQVTFMNEFRDSLEASIIAYQYTMGKSDKKDMTVWARTIKEKLGMLNGITWNGKRPFSYTQSPWFWRDVLVGTFGADMNRLSSDHIAINNPPVDKEGTTKAYSYYVYDFLKNDLGLTNVEINVNKTMQLLGVNITENERGRSVFVKNRTSRLIRKDHNRTVLLTGEQDRIVSRRRSINSDEIRPYINIVQDATKYPGNSDFKRLINDFDHALSIGEISYISGLAYAITEFQPVVA